MGASPLPDDEEASMALAGRLRSLALQPQEGRPDSPMATEVSGLRFKFPENDRGITSVQLEPNRDGTVLVLGDGNTTHRISCGRGSWTAGRTRFEPPALVKLGVTHDGSDVPCAACGAWTADDAFVAKLTYTETPFIEALTLKFEPDSVTFDQLGNLSMLGWDARKRPQLVGISG